MSATLEIPVGRSRVAVVDAADAELVAGRNWSSYVRNGIVYAVASFGDLGTRLMHRVIAGEPDGMDVDHRDGDGLNNRRSNLRVCSRQNNLRNSRKRKALSSRYKGVYFCNFSQRWVMEIDSGYGKRYSRRCATELEAAQKYDEFARRLFGEFACLNFPSANEESCLVA